jgi:hypothetical protein
MEQIKIIKECAEAIRSSDCHNSRVIVDYADEILKALSQVKQPTVNEALIKRLTKHIDDYKNTIEKANGQPVVLNYRNDEVENTAWQLANLLVDCKTALSQVKPSVVWRKYPENIPVFSDRTGGVCLYKPNEKGDKEIRCHSGNSLPIEDGDYYCYEADLISTIKE